MCAVKEQDVYYTPSPQTWAKLFLTGLLLAAFCAITAVAGTEKLPHPASWRPRASSASRVTTPAACAATADYSVGEMTGTARRIPLPASSAN